MATRSWRSVAWNPGDDAQKRQLLAFLHAEYGDNEVASAAYYDWLLRRNPCGEAIVRIALGEDGAVAGQYVVAPMQLAIEGTTHNGALSLLTLTDPRYRGQGIFTALARDVYGECARRGLAFVLGFPNQSSYPGFIRSLQFRVVGELPLLLRPLKPSRLVEAKLGGRIGAAARALAAPLDHFYAPPRRDSAAPIEEVERFGDGFDRFDAMLARRFRVHQPRTARFLSWRFHECPRDYSAYAWHDAGRLRGYVVLRRTTVSGLASGMLVDFFVDDGSDAFTIGSALVRFALDRLARMDAHLAGALVNGDTTEHAILKAHGFFTCPKRFAPQPFPVILKSTVAGWETDKPVTSLAAWALEMGDYDAV